MGLYSKLFFVIVFCYIGKNCSKLIKRTKRILLRKKNENENENKVGEDIRTMPADVTIEILARTANSSFDDFFSAKLSCKAFYRVSEEDSIYERVSLNKFPVISWGRVSDKVTSFLNKCKECGNPESLYRQGLMDIFKDNKLDSGLDYLEKAANKGHKGALYVQGIALLFGKDESKLKGVKIISGLKKSETEITMRDCRENFKDFLMGIWRKSTIPLGKTPTCCALPHHQNANAWDVHSRFLDQECEGCQSDLELALISSV